MKERCAPSLLCYFRSQRPVNTVPGPALYQQPPCRRCQASGTPCIFEKPEKKNVQGLSTASVEYALSFVCHHYYVSSVCHRRLSRLEGQYLVLLATCLQSFLNLIILLFQVMQSQMIGMQSSLDRILSAVQTQNGNGPHPQLFTPMEAHRDGNSITHHRNGFDAGPTSAMRSFPPLPGFTPPVSHVFRPSSYQSHPSIAS